MKFKFPKSINSDFEGYRILINFYDEVKNLVFDEVILDFNDTEWIEANLIAIIGAILNKVQSELNDVKIKNLSKEINNLFSRNHFLSHFGGLKIPDYYDTTIKYRKFKTTEEKLFTEYLDRELLSKEAMPNMSDLLRKKINESIFEIFNNAVIHGHCDNIFSCGQYYPIKKNFGFTIVDMGNTIKSEVNNYMRNTLGNILSGKDAIEWATVVGHTTRQGTIPGGLGLSLIRGFLEKNNGKIQIVSADGYWEQKGNRTTDTDFTQSFPGTIVNLKFTIDENYYYLSSEVKEEEIF